MYILYMFCIKLRHVATDQPEFIWEPKSNPLNVGMRAYSHHCFHAIVPDNHFTFLQVN